MPINSSHTLIMGKTLEIFFSEIMRPMAYIYVAEEVRDICMYGEIKGN